MNANRLLDEYSFARALERGFQRENQNKQVENAVNGSTELYPIRMAWVSGVINTHLFVLTAKSD